MKADDLIQLPEGSTVSKRVLFDLIQFSKVEGSDAWDGESGCIHNTPQQGINWIGLGSDCRALITKVRHKSYEDDGWVDDARTRFSYSFMARAGVVNYAHAANQAILNQVEFGYPIILLLENKSDWIVAGHFSVTEIADRSVVLSRTTTRQFLPKDALDTGKYTEGGKKYAVHLFYERNSSIVRQIKARDALPCDICKIDFLRRYGAKYIEAHHKTPLSTFGENHEVHPKDFALLCPNCHKAVHLQMKITGDDYEVIADRIRRLAL